MAEESFEDEEVASLLNKYFVSIKVDREERPDIDMVYMNVCTMLTGSGGWPLTVILTPDKAPIYAGTYFPKRTKYGRHGLIDILATIAEKWQTDKESLHRVGNEIINAILESQAVESGKEEMTLEYFHNSRNHFASIYDEKHGGFGSAPKFPTPHNLLFLLRYGVFENDKKAIEMAANTLIQMYKGGIFDHIAGGFSRYSTDNEWLLPHFEKMLYDNALLIMAYLEAYQITKNELFKNIVVKTFKYISQEMVSVEGGFYSAQDADSDGVEGKYYVFTPSETILVLGEEDGKLFNANFDITQEGNFEGKSIPNLINNPNYANFIDQVHPIGARFNEIFAELYEYRKQRTSLSLDDKILTAWNALMIAASAKAYSVLQNPKYLILARNAACFIENHLSDGQGNLYVSYREGTKNVDGFLDDYAFTIFAYLTLYQTVFEVEWLVKAVTYAQNMVKKFYDEKDGGFYFYSDQNETLFLRPKETYDGALPSGNSVAAYIINLLAKITADPYWEELAYKQLQFIARTTKHYPSGHSFGMMAGMMNLYPAKELIVVLPGDEVDMSDIRRLFAKHSLYNVTCIVKTPANAKTIEKIAPYTKNYDAKKSNTTYYLCHNKVCHTPVISVEELEKLLFKD